jgi:Tol biopolymer transport system component/tRNA A-37 threonylcarbamoyl transferase component Bud32
MGLTSGTRIGAFEILTPLGAGGMGEVYRARDTKLARDVALKILPEALARDPERMARFQREAQILASLNHPNIAAIYGMEVGDGVCALVMELVEGPTVAERLKAGALPMEDALSIARQVAEALEAAHDRGVIHRDLKPANIKVASDNTTKILDFGLAKALAPEDSGANISNSPTLTAAATQVGVILGTAAYMSPEQAKGKPVDRRADIFAFGCVLYEMLAGKRTFEGETVSETLASVLKTEPDFSALPATTPPAIRNLVRRCLEKDSKRRLQAIGEARIAIEETIAGVTVGLAPARAESAEGRPQGSPLQRALPWALTAVLAAAVAVLLVVSRRPSASAERMQFALPVEAEVIHLSLSADGRMLAFVARDESSGENMIHVQRLGSPRATLLTGTEGASYPFWSPDNAYVGFFANGKLKKVAVSGGSPQAIASATYPRGGTWGNKGVIVYCPEAGGFLWRVNADGTHAAPLTDKLYLSTESSHRWPVFLPDGDHFLFWSGVFGANRSDAANGIYLSSLEAKDKKQVISGHSNCGYANGHLYYMDDSKSVLALAFDARRGETTGEPIAVSDNVTYQPSVYWAAFAVGGNDTVVFNTSSSAALSVLTWYDRTGKKLSEIGQPGILANPSVSPDGRRAAFDNSDLKTSNVDVWTEDLERETGSRFSFDPAEDATAVWSRDGKVIAYRSIAVGDSVLIVKDASGGEAPKIVHSVRTGDDAVPNSWSRDGQKLLCSYQPLAGGSDLTVLDLKTSRMTPFVATKAGETNGQISPDGKWAAYASNESGDWEIYVTAFPSAQGKWQVSRGGGIEPRWNADGREIFYIDPKGTLTSMPVTTNGTFSAGAPSRLFQIHGRAPISSTDLFTYDVAKGGKRFLVNRYVTPQHIEPLTVVLNAAAGR